MARDRFGDVLGASTLLKRKRKRKIPTRIRKDLMYKPQKCSYCRKQPSMHLHHIRGFAKGGSSRETNLVPLCANCHYKVHHGMITTNQLKRRVGIKITPRKKPKKPSKKRKKESDSIFYGETHKVFPWE